MFFKNILGLKIRLSMLGTRHQAAIAKPMQQRVHAAQAIELAEFLSENTLEIPSPKGTHRIVPAWTRLDPRTKSVAFLRGQLFASSLSRTMLKSLHARLVVATHPFLNRSPRRIHRFGNLLGRSPSLLTTACTQFAFAHALRSAKHRNSSNP